MCRSSYKEVHVRLVDLNDHSPVFDQEEYRVRIPESALPNTPLTRLKVKKVKSVRFPNQLAGHPNLDFIGGGPSL